MSYSSDRAGVRHGPCVVIAKYSSPRLRRGFFLIAVSSGALDVVPTYFKSAAFSSLAWMQPVAALLRHVCNVPLLAWSSNPATSDLIAVPPLPWLSWVPLSRSDAV